MSRRILTFVFVSFLLFTTACTNKKSVNPLANIGSKQPDKVLFDRAMDAMKHNRFDVARITLETLINTYPDSEYIARAKLAVGDSWYAEGGTASLAQAEQQYRDFQTFFPNMPEAAEAQLKIANIQYQQMEKADRDYTHAKRAEEEYRNLILQYPDNAKLVAEGKQRLLEVQEVLAEREFQIGRFYYLRQSYDASIARLQSLVDKYPLYSRADEALYLLGQNREGQIARLHSTPVCDSHGKPPGCTTAAAKEKAIALYTPSLIKDAAKDYAQIITRYPIMDRADDAKKRLEALHQPVPRPTKAAVARNRAEDESRRDVGTFGRLTNMFMKHPDMEQATKVGEPTLVDPTPVSAKEVNDKTMQGFMDALKTTGTQKTLAVETVKPGEMPGPNEAPPRSDTPAPSSDATAAQPNATPDANELQPAAPPTPRVGPAGVDPNELKPNTPDAQNATETLPPPTQVNEIQQGQATASASANADSAPASDQDISSSKKKKKKGVKKIVPF
ncbi:MAG TPA: outer membrane protein assembly factor BamD [Candidatus Sulfotelmatobacter sp.]|nr:outer membrane protein assembly factor BamD [Candidatus Sulfotelmatobacter sp.]